MKLKYYLRGLGLGIFVTTLILVIAYNVNGRISDDEVIRRAKALGMVMATDESDELFNKPSDNAETTKADIEETTPDETTTADKETETTEETTTEAATTKEAETETTEPVRTFTFYIEKGTSSQAVSEILLEGGIVTDAKDFNDYMLRSGYAGIIQRGTYTLDSSMTYEEIAKALIQMEENS